MLHSRSITAINLETLFSRNVSVNEFLQFIFSVVYRDWEKHLLLKIELLNFK